MGRGFEEIQKGKYFEIYYYELVKFYQPTLNPGWRLKYDPEELTNICCCSWGSKSLDIVWMSMSKWHNVSAFWCMAAGRSSLKSKQKFGGMKIVVGYTSSICDSSPFFQVSTSTNNIQRGNLLFFIARVVLCFNLFTRTTGKLSWIIIS
jgi:hypothetical protein